MTSSCQVVALALALGACAMEPPSPEVSLTEHSQALWAVETGAVTTLVWDSGKTENLSPWKSIDCNGTYGSAWLLSALRAFADAGSVDKFIAKLTGTCSSYQNAFGLFLQDGHSDSAVIFSANHKTPGELTEISLDRYVNGVELELDNFSDYVQRLRMFGDKITASGELGDNEGTTWVGPHGFLIGPLHALMCPRARVITGLALRYDTQKGKIRTLKVTCRPLTDS